MKDNLEKLKAIELERKDLLSKLQKIEEKKGSVSHEVYIKVKTDYETRLKKIDEALAENKELVKMEMDRLNGELSELKKEEKNLRLNLEEIELRYTIGEYSEDKFHELQKENKEKLNKVEGQIRELEERIRWCRGLLGEEIIEEEKVVEKVSVEEKKEAIEELKIDEHILEEKIPEEVKKLDELLIETNALLESAEEATGKVKKEKEEGIACPKCGFLNPPDSWYCEKCGAEILTI
ncbi:MAG: hypothetical protein N3A65_05385 [candidate division WOR-3 bacterium]|nr:hypothetical protein [candidate division WOR-3 bacterium]